MIDELRRKREARDCDLLLLLTAVIEIANHIAQLADDRARRTCAERFAGVFRTVVVGNAPWALNEVEWDAGRTSAR